MQLWPQIERLARTLQWLPIISTLFLIYLWFLNEKKKYTSCKSVMWFDIYHFICGALSVVTVTWSSWPSLKFYELLANSFCFQEWQFSHRCIHLVRVHKYKIVFKYQKKYLFWASVLFKSIFHLAISDKASSTTCFWLIFYCFKLNLFNSSSFFKMCIYP